MALLTVIPLAVSSRFFDPWTGVKWALTGVLACIAIGALTFSGKVFVPRVPFIIPIALGLPLLTAFNNWRLGLGFFGDTALAQLSALVIFIAAYNVFFRRPGAALRMGLANLAAISAFAVIAFYLQFQSGMPWAEAISSTMGNPNMAAQYIAFAMALALPLLFDNAPIATWTKALIVFTVIISISFVYLTKCRSVLVGMIIYLAIFAVQSLFSSRRRGIVLLAGLGVCASLIILGPQANLGVPKSLGQWNNFSARERLNLWGNSLALIRDHPMGVGSDQFLFEYPRYRFQSSGSAQEGILDKTPHNEFIRFTVNEGIVWTLLAVFASGAIIHFFLRTLGGRRNFFIGFTGIVVIESIFQFPFMMAFPVCAVGIAGGFFMARSGAKQRELVSITLFPLAIAIVCAALLFILENTLMSRNPVFSRDWAALACRIHPGSIDVCLIDVDAKADNGKLDSAAVTLNTIMRKDPYYYPALFRWSLGQIGQDRISSGCEGLRIYDRMFPNGNSARTRVNLYCDPPDTVSSTLKDAMRALEGRIKQSI